MLDWIATIATLCETAAKAGQALIQWRADQLTEDERELLIAASAMGMIHLTRSDMYGRFVVVNGEAKVSNDPVTGMRYFEAFQSLCQRGLISHDQGGLFRMTIKAIDLGRAMQKQHTDQVKLHLPEQKMGSTN